MFLFFKILYSSDVKKKSIRYRLMYVVALFTTHISKLIMKIYLKIDVCEIFYFHAPNGIISSNPINLFENTNFIASYDSIIFLVTSTGNLMQRFAYRKIEKSILNHENRLFSENVSPLNIWIIRSICIFYETKASYEQTIF